jgi:DNA-binding transcriptional ArsR family regulator
MNTPSCIGTARRNGPEVSGDADLCDVPAIDEVRVASLRPGNLGADDAAGLSAIFSALSDPTRLRLLDALARAEELCVCDLCALLNLRQSNVSHQLRLLRGLRIVKNRRAGRLVFYSLDDDHVRRLLREGLDHVREAARAEER